MLIRPGLSGRPPYRGAADYAAVKLYEPMTSGTNFAPGKAHEEVQEFLSGPSETEIFSYDKSVYRYPHFAIWSRKSAEACLQG